MNEKVKKLIGIMIFIGILSLTLYFIFKEQSLTSIIQALLAVNPWFIFLGFFMMILFIACDALKLSLVLKEFNFSISFLKTLGYAFVGFYFSSITPSASGGQPAQMYYMSKDDIHVSYSSLTLLITTIVYQVATILYGVTMFVLNYSFVIDQLYGVKLLLFISLCINSLMIIAMLAIMFSKRFAKVLVYIITIILYKLRLIKDLAATRDKIEIQLGEYTKGADYIKT
ncbi:MAG: lysylphosphatidylglycerol synthase transmembrane domain-containing protein, partial [Turicibacter sp.]